MKGQHRVLLFLVAMGMELSCLYACATFLTTSLFHHPFPFPEAVGSFGLAAVLTLLSEGRGWRVIYGLGFQALGFVPALLRMVHVFNSWSHSFVTQTWLLKFSGTSADHPDYGGLLPVGVIGWFVAVLVVLWALFFWVVGRQLAKRPTDYFTICSRFDRGLIAFFIIFLVKFLLQLIPINGGIKIAESMSVSLLFPFLIFSLLAIGLVRNRNAAPRDFLPGYQGIGVILSFAVVILLLGTGLVLFGLHYLTLAAETGYAVLKIAAGPVGFILGKVLRFIFGYPETDIERIPRPHEGELVPREFQPHGPSAWWLVLLGQIFYYGLWVMTGLILLTIVGVTLFLIVHWLLSKTSVSQERQSARYLISLWVERLRLFLISCRSWLVRKLKGYHGAIQLYTALRGWGRHSGLPHFLSETPIEYGLRLKQRFPVLTGEIESIIAAFNEEVYGEIILNDHQLTGAHVAWRRLRSPLYWPSRLRAWFRRPLDQENGSRSFPGIQQNT
ncbi:MAG: DUF4129 domain-containing protein [Desulfobacterales bacterium]|nr:DUF4129 domain-containing protein [Desulfobacterales bacterium]